MNQAGESVGPRHSSTEVENSRSSTSVDKFSEVYDIGDVLKFEEIILGNSPLAETTIEKDIPGNSQSKETDVEEKNTECPASVVIKSGNLKLQRKGAENIANPHREGVIYKKEDGSELEDGEIYESSNSESNCSYSCRYYRKGRCYTGKNCRFLHITEKGVYSMFEQNCLCLSDKVTEHFHRYSNKLESNCLIIHPSPREKETDWDRALKEAVERVERTKKDIALKREKLRMTLHRDDNKSYRKHSEHARKRKSSRSLLHRIRESSNQKQLRCEVAVDSMSIEKKPMGKAKFLLNCRYSWKKSSTPVHMRWSPKTVSESSRSRSRSCSSSPSRPSKYKHRRRSSSPESSSTSVFKMLSRRRHRKSPDKKSRTTFRMVKKHHKPDKNVGFKKLEKKNSSYVERNICQLKIPKFQKKKVVSSSKRSRTSCSDMSISPPSQSNKKSSRVVESSANSRPSHRCPSDMSISSLSDVPSPEVFFSQSEINDLSIQKSCPEKLNSHSFLETREVRFSQQAGKRDEGSKSCTEKESSLDVVRNEKFGTQKSVHLKIASQKKIVSQNNNSNPKNIKLIKKSDPLLMDLMKYHGNTQRSHWIRHSKSVPPKDSPIKHVECKTTTKKEQMMDSDKKVLSKKEYLIKRLEEVDAAIEKIERVKKSALHKAF